ncbi:hypothetical protein GCM10007916_24950 [Psychromonas marina]|uniref:EAL domain-containing protein n=1 Tax=Psychromonas marina TaxID=88364 RepID=A0ABQ6E358_9GAMM|nr:bacteriohemerythrin [Psychromonas marina]GLS91426.1 hypothetical protein GCM10007916_24950 [Psychromonas marina]
MKNNEIDVFEIFPWDKNFETNIELIDSQHKKLVSILNRLAGHLAHRSTPVVLNDIFDELADYATYHFKCEEEIWTGYFKEDAWYREHQKTHQSFLMQALAIKNQKDLSLDEIIYEIVSFLTQWLAYHILDSDKRMVLTINAIDAGQSIEGAKAHADQEMSGLMSVLVNTVLAMYNNISIRTLDLMREKSLRIQAEEALKESENALLSSKEQWEFVSQESGETIWDWHVSTTGIEFSQQTQLLNYIVGTESLTNATITNEDLAGLQQSLVAHNEGKTSSYRQRYRLLHHDGSYSWILSRGKIINRDLNGTPIRMVGTRTDLTKPILANIIYNNSDQGMFIADVKKHIISVNPAFTDITGYKTNEIIGQSHHILSSGEVDFNLSEAMWQGVSENGQWAGEFWFKHKNGNRFPILLNVNTVKMSNGEISQYIVLFSDISNIKDANDLIEKHENYDLLTTLPNRGFFAELLTQDIKRLAHSTSKIAVLFIDLDQFKEINETLGYLIGDQLLVQVAQRILKCVRKSDTVSRFGGDEFSVIISDVTENKEIDYIAQQIITAFINPFQINEEQVHISASIGITLFPDDATTVVDLLKNADQAMYLSKSLGRNGYSYFTPYMQIAAQQKQALLRELRNVIVNDQLEVVYQPIVNFKTNKILKAEALVRWNHPERGVISPLDFIPLAEEYGLILEIGDWIFKQAAKQALIWQAKFGEVFKISINISPLQLLAPQSSEMWLDYLQQIGLPCENVVLEITEGLMMETEQKIIAQLSFLRDAGIEISLDDFGTGYSSLSYIKDFDIDYIKIDQSFVLHMSAHSQESLLCEAMIDMAHKLGLVVVAEGIETVENKQLLFEMGCDYGQGFYFSKPLPVQLFEQRFLTVL